MLIDEEGQFPVLGAILDDVASTFQATMMGNTPFFCFEFFDDIQGGWNKKKTAPPPPQWAWETLLL